MEAAAVAAAAGDLEGAQEDEADSAAGTVAGVAVGDSDTASNGVEQVGATSVGSSKGGGNIGVMGEAAARRPEPAGSGLQAAQMLRGMQNHHRTPTDSAAQANVSFLEVNGFDPYRLYSDATYSAGWRENRDELWKRRFWTHVGMRITTWSMLEVLQLNGLEDFLLQGQWGLFACVPEDLVVYEDLEWTLDLYLDDRLQNRAAHRLSRGALVVAIGMPRPGVAEVMLPDDEVFFRTYYAYYRFPLNEGRRYLQRLPALEHKEEGSMRAVTMPTFKVLPVEDGDDSAALIVTQGRDPRSAVLGYLAAGALIGLADIVGSRAQLGRVALAGPDSFSGAWISILAMNGRPTLERLLEQTENMINDAKLKAEQARIAAIMASGEDDDTLSPKSTRDRAKLFGTAASPAGVSPEMSRPGPGLMHKVLPPKMEQRVSVTGGWRSMIDPVWKRQVFFAPLGGRATWGINEVLHTGGLDDLLLARCWDVCVVDPLAVEAMKDPTWAFEVYADPGLSGEPVFRYEKGRMIVVQVFDITTFVAHVLLPPPGHGGESATGYGKYRMRDGRPLLRSLMHPPQDFDGVRPQPVSELEPANLDRAEPPEEDEHLLPGPYFCTPPGDDPELPVSVGQDLGSVKWAAMPRGFRVGAFEEVAGMRARLPDLDGGGWVSLFSPDGRPLFWKQPKPPPVLELPTVGVTGENEEPWLPVVWPDFGLERRPALNAGKSQLSTTLSVQEQRSPSLPEVLAKMGGGRALCDWFRTNSFSGFAWRNPLTLTITTLDDLLARGIWKAVIVEASESRVREAGALSSNYIKTLPRSSLVIAEWVAPGNAVRILTPADANDPRPQHFWTDLGGVSGAALVPLLPGGHFWVEPKGGHLPEEHQEDEDSSTKVMVRARKNLDSEVIGSLQRGDAVQLAEISGRFGRIVVTTKVLSYAACPSGWIDIFDDAGWSVLKAKHDDDVHPEVLRFSGLKEVPEEPERPRRPIAPPPPHVPAELPPLLWQLGEKEAGSLATSDWREQRDPVWGRRYFVNRWSGQIIHHLARMNVACACVRLTFCLANLSVHALRSALGVAGAEKRRAELEASTVAGLAQLADVPDDMVNVCFEDGGCGEQCAAEEAEWNNPESVDESFKRAKDAEASSAAGVLLHAERALVKSEETSHALVTKQVAERDIRPRLRVVSMIRAPGARSAWASASLKQAMADRQHFIAHIETLLTSLPRVLELRVEVDQPVDFKWAKLEELDVPRRELQQPQLLPEPISELPVDEDIASLRKNMRYERPALLQFPCRPLGAKAGNAQALADGFKSAATEPHLEELGLWGCQLGDFGAAALAGALALGCGAKLQTLLLDDNGIAGAGATALGKGLAGCSSLRELGVARNPLSKGFSALIAGVSVTIVMLDASDAVLDDTCALAMAAALPKWSLLKSLRLGGNNDISVAGAEAIARGLLSQPAVKLADLKGCAAGPEDAARVGRLLEAGGSDASRMRL